MVMQQKEDGAIYSRIKNVRDVLNVRLNDDEKKILIYCKDQLEQPKDSTALKQLAFIGAKVVLDNLTGEILKVVYENKRKNKRLGYNVEYE